MKIISVRKVLGAIVSNIFQMKFFYNISIVHFFSSWNLVLIFLDASGKNLFEKAQFEKNFDVN